MPDLSDLLAPVLARLDAIDARNADLAAKVEALASRPRIGDLLADMKPPRMTCPPPPPDPRAAEIASLTEKLRAAEAEMVDLRAHKEQNAKAWTAANKRAERAEAALSASLTERAWLTDALANVERERAQAEASEQKMGEARDNLAAEVARLARALGETQARVTKAEQERDARAVEVGLLKSTEIRLRADADEACDYAQTIADEAFGPFPAMSLTDALHAIERGHSEHHRRAFNDEQAIRRIVEVRGDEPTIAAVERMRDELTRLRASGPAAAVVEAARCNLTCPHGDRCRLASGHADGCNHACACNEPNEPGLWVTRSMVRSALRVGVEMTDTADADNLWTVLAAGDDLTKIPSEPKGRAARRDAAPQPAAKGERYVVGRARDAKPGQRFAPFGAKGEKAAGAAAKVMNGDPEHVGSWAWDTDATGYPSDEKAVIDTAPPAPVEAPAEQPDPVADFIERHAIRIAEQAGESWDALDGEEQTWWCSQVHDVLNNLRGLIDDGGDCAVVDGRGWGPRRKARPITSGMASVADATALYERYIDALDAVNAAANHDFTKAECIEALRRAIVAPTTRRCDECGVVVDTGPPGDGPKGGRKWCSEACADKATANEPGWIRVADLTPVQRAELDAIVAPPTDIPSPEVARALLDHLRPSEDKPFSNPFGERVWLRPCLDDDGRRIGLTECCLVDAPCERHAEMPHGGIMITPAHLPEPPPAPVEAPASRAEARAAFHLADAMPEAQVTAGVQGAASTGGVPADDEIADIIHAAIWPYAGDRRSCSAEHIAGLDETARLIRERFARRTSPPVAVPQPVLDLLARIHRDGGQYVDTHGVAKAATDAEVIVVQRMASPPVAIDAGALAEAYHDDARALGCVPSWRRGLTDSERLAVTQAMRRALSSLASAAPTPAPVEPVAWGIESDGRLIFADVSEAGVRSACESKSDARAIVPLYRSPAPVGRVPVSLPLVVEGPVWSDFDEDGWQHAMMGKLKLAVQRRIESTTGDARDGQMPRGKVNTTDGRGSRVNLAQSFWTTEEECRAFCVRVATEINGVTLVAGEAGE